MEQVESVPFSALIAGMLLCQRTYNSASIVNTISGLQAQGVMVDDENDNMDDLSCCVEVSPNYCFQLKKGLKYDTVLYSDITVFDFLMMHTNERVLTFLGIDHDSKFFSSKMNQDMFELDSNDDISHDTKNKFFVRKKKLSSKKEFAW